MVSFNSSSLFPARKWEALGSDKKKYVWKHTQKRRERLKGVYIRAKRKVNEQFGRNMDVNGNRKLFWKEVRYVKGGKVESCSRIKDGNRRLAQGEDEVQRIWKENFKGLYNIDTQEQVAVHMCGFDGIRRGNYFRGELIGKAEVEVRVGELQNGKGIRKDEITREMIKGGGDKVVDWIWKLYNITFEHGVVPENWGSAVIFPLYKGKGERTKCKNYRGISLLSVVGKLYAGILVDKSP